MSECNFCSLRKIKARNKGKEIELKPDLVYKLGGYNVYVDGEFIGWWFMEITDHCVC